MDAIYLQKVRNGDVNAFSWFVRQYKDLAYSIALKITGNEQDAEEIVQDGFLKAFQSIDQFKGTAKFSTWLYKIVYHTAISRTRRKRIETEPLDNAGIDHEQFADFNQILDNIVQEQREQYFRSALQKLDVLDYILLTLFYYDDCSHKEIAGITGLEVSYIKVRMQRARQKLYDELKKLLKTELNQL